MGRFSQAFRNFFRRNTRVGSGTANARRMGGQIAAGQKPTFRRSAKRLAKNIVSPPKWNGAMGWSLGKKVPSTGAAGKTTSTGAQYSVTHRLVNEATGKQMRVKFFTESDKGGKGHHMAITVSLPFGVNKKQSLPVIKSFLQSTGAMYTELPKNLRIIETEKNLVLMPDAKLQRRKTTILADAKPEFAMPERSLLSGRTKELTPVKQPGASGSRASGRNKSPFSRADRNALERGMRTTARRGRARGHRATNKRI